MSFGSKAPATSSQSLKEHAKSHNDQNGSTTTILAKPTMMQTILTTVSLAFPESHAVRELC
jgi:hypothetical protein